MEPKRIFAEFYRTASGREPVREFLLELNRDDKKSIGIAISKLEYRWPQGLPLCRPLGAGLWEVRVDLTSNRIARVLFGIVSGRMVLVHAFIKKSQKTPRSDLELGRERLNEVLKHDK
ncbi:MAG: type II toxin-antitoxin system RelE/ParE family toxin [Candidatus Hydrogenedens sp.]|nr:type II toxin-antitoxin system RelE/ParE family toxin [Candidatus Hydrogenedens sp.]